MTLKIRLYFTGIITLAIWLLLAWDHFHGGVPSHHILANKDLPSISNWWGGLLIPLLSWWLLYRIATRINTTKTEATASTELLKSVVYGFIGALLFGIIVATSFSLGYSGITGYIMLSAFVLALFIPIYKSEYLLGFVVGMTYTFGGVLPIAIGTILLLIGAIIYLFLRKGIIYIYKKAFMEK